MTHDAVGSLTTGSPPNAISQLSHNFNGWLTWARALHPCGYFDNWRDAGGSLPINPLDKRIIAQVSDTPATQSTWARLFYGGMQARGGQLIEIAQRNSDLLVALDPELTFIGIGESNVYTDTASSLSTKLQNLVNTVLNGTNSRVLLMCPITRASIAGNASSFIIGNPTDDGYRQRLVDVVPLLQAAYVGNPRVRVFDPNPILTGGTALNIPLAFWLVDHIHLTARGAYYIGKAVAQVLQAWGFPDYSEELYPLPAAYNASSNPQGNVIINPLFTGSGGTKGTGVTGTLPDYHRLDRTIGDASVVSSVETLGDGTKKLVLTFTPGASVSTFELQFTNTVNGSAELANPFATGTWFRAHMFAECSAYDDWRLARLWLRPSADSFTIYGGHNVRYAAGRTLYTNESYAAGLSAIQNVETHMPDEAWEGYIDTPPYQMVGSGGTIRTRLQIMVGPTSGSPIVKISEPVVRAIDDPRPAYGIT
jgi:lysophospholipase L1-like esterase